MKSPSNPYALHGRLPEIYFLGFCFAEQSLKPDTLRVFVFGGAESVVIAFLSGRPSSYASIHTNNEKYFLVMDADASW